MKKGIMKFTASLAAILLSTSALAVEISLQDVVDGITCNVQDSSCGGTGAASSTNVATDMIAFDETWELSANGGNALFVVELAGNALSNAFGIYDPTNGNLIELFAGNDSTGASVSIGLWDDGTVLLNNAPTEHELTSNLFGFYLSGPGGTFYSQSAWNPDSVDTMLAYQGEGDYVKIGQYAAGQWGENHYLLAWEDTANGDRDFQDLVVLVESIRPVPAPGTLALLGLGLLGLGAARRRKA